ncbi:MAG: glycosyltransferase family 2 protein [Hyphomicrobiales bacterium]
MAEPDGPRTDASPTTVELSIIVPTYNEAGNIAELMARLDRALAGIAWEMIVVDDDSPDRTYEVAKAIAGHDPRIRCIRRIDKRGLAGACIEGMSSSAAPYLAVMDADLQHDEAILPEMLQRLKAGKLDIVIGSRRRDGGSMEDGLSAYRVGFSRCAGALTRKLLRIEVDDVMSGFFAMKRDVFDAVAPSLDSSGFKILADILSSGPSPLRFAEIGYHFRPRSTGESKADLKSALDLAGLVLHKLTGGLVPGRFVCFGIVGASGVIVHLVSLALLLEPFARHGFAYAQASATGIAMTSNYLVNNISTYRDRRLKGRAFYSGLLAFYLVCSVGAIANVSVATSIYHYEPIWWLAGLGGVLMGSVWNYALSSRYVWRDVK